MPPDASAVRVAVLDDYQQVALTSADWSPLHGRARIEVFTDHLDDELALGQRLETYDVVVAMRERTPFPRSLIERLPRLRLLVTTAQRNASIDVAAATEQGVLVCGTGMVPTGTPELTWGLVLAAHRHLETELATMRGGGWQTTVGTELAGRTLGLLGLGRIGSKVAGYAHAFDMQVLAWSSNLTDEMAAARGALRVERDELFRRSDVVSIHLRLSDRSRGLVGADELARLGPDGWLVNTSRGPIVDEAALLDALRERRIAGAALDVYDEEPLPSDHPLRTLPNALVTPHVGYVTRQNYAVFFSGVVEDVAAWLDGDPVRVVPAG